MQLSRTQIAVMPNKADAVDAPIPLSFNSCIIGGDATDVRL